MLPTVLFAQKGYDKNFADDVSHASVRLIYDGMSKVVNKSHYKLVDTVENLRGTFKVACTYADSRGKLVLHMKVERLNSRKTEVYMISVSGNKRNRVNHYFLATGNSRHVKQINRVQRRRNCSLAVDVNWDFEVINGDPKAFYVAHAINKKVSKIIN